MQAAEHRWTSWTERVRSPFGAFPEGGAPGRNAATRLPFASGPRRRRYGANVRALLTSCLLSLPLSAQDTPPNGAAAELAAELATLVDLPTPQARQARADALAKRRDVGLEAWVAAMRGFGTFTAQPAGVTVARVDLPVGDTIEDTEIETYVPATYDPARAAPLALVGHGTGGSGRGLASLWRDAADALGMVVVAPSEAGANDGYAFSDRERQAAFAAVRWARRRFHVDENRVFVGGISRGGHLAWDLALRFPDHFAGIVPMIGGPRVNPVRGQNNLRYLANVVPLAIRDLQGSQDDPRLVFNVRTAFAKLKEAQATDAQLFEFPELGHSFDLAAVDWRAFFGESRRSPAPLRVVRAFARPGEGRAFWLEVEAGDKTVTEDVPLRATEAEWKRLEADDAAMRRFLDARTAACTARAEATRLGGNRFEVRSDKVARLRLLLSADMVDLAQPVRVVWNGKASARRVAPSPRLLLREFAERFDRTFLPIVEVRP